MLQARHRKEHGRRGGEEHLAVVGAAQQRWFLELRRTARRRRGVTWCRRPVIWRWRAVLFDVSGEAEAVTHMTD
jgi:hypothetical protein